ncbi:MAG: hypothetical protein IIZ39_12150 [Blautia sp.]|nr:hypothetical protein [Blautia sp.]
MARKAPPFVILAEDIPFLEQMPENTTPDQAKVARTLPACAKEGALIKETVMFLRSIALKG